MPIRAWEEALQTFAVGHLYYDVKSIYAFLCLLLKDVIKLDFMASLKKKEDGLTVLLKSQSNGNHLVHMFHVPGRGLS